MTYLELVAAVGTIPMDMARMYFNGGLTEKELKNMIGRKKAGLVESFVAQQYGKTNNSFSQNQINFKS